MKNKNKHILIVSSEFPPGPGGIGDHAFNLANQLTNNDFNVTVLTEFRTEFSGKWTTCDSQFNTVYLSRESTFFSVRFFAKFIHLILYEHFDLIIATGHKSIMLVGLLSLFKKINSFVVIHGHEVNSGSKVNIWLIRTLIDRFTQIIAVSEFSKSIVNKYIRKDRIHVIPNGFNDKKFSGIELLKTFSQTTIRLLTVGRISRRKGQYGVVELLPTLMSKLKKKIEYHVVGIDSERDIISAHAMRFDVQENLIIHGILSNYSIEKLFAEMDVFIMLSENTSDGDVEGFGIAIIEANYFGLPSIGSRGCGIEQAINDGHSGFLVDRGNTDEISEAIQTIIENRTKFALEAKEWAKEHLWTRMIIRYLELFNIPKP